MWPEADIRRHGFAHSYKGDNGAWLNVAGITPRLWLRRPVRPGRPPRLRPRRAAGGLWGSEAGSLQQGGHRGRRRRGRDRYLHRAAAPRAAHRSGQHEQLPAHRRPGQGRVPRLHRLGVLRQQHEAGAAARRPAGSGLHPGADPEHIPDHRADPGLGHSTRQWTRPSRPGSKQQPPGSRCKRTGFCSCLGVGSCIGTKTRD